MNSMTITSKGRGEQSVRRYLTKSAALAAVAALVSAPTVATETADAIAIDESENVRTIIRYVDRQVTASEARRAAYRYLGELGYSRYSDLGAARVRSTTREGDTWIIEVGYSTGGRVLSRRALLYVDANTSLVSEVPPASDDNRVASR